jgi:hypothetical protein
MGLNEGNAKKKERRAEQVTAELREAMTITAAR